MLVVKDKKVDALVSILARFGMAPLWTSGTTLIYRRHKRYVFPTTIIHPRFGCNSNLVRRAMKSASKGACADVGTFIHL